MKQRYCFLILVLCTVVVSTALLAQSASHINSSIATVHIHSTVTDFGSLTHCTRYLHQLSTERAAVELKTAADAGALAALNSKYDLLYDELAARDKQLAAMTARAVEAEAEVRTHYITAYFSDDH
jgi:hypothetical protein